MDVGDPLSLEDIQRALRDLERLGWVRRNGEFRNGRPVYVITELGRTQGIELPTLQ